MPNPEITANAKNPFHACTLCPRECKANRLEGDVGYCRTDSNIHISAICAHKGEEPVISGANGICNIFFSHCNLQCIYCQNHTISRNSPSVISRNYTLNLIVERIEHVLSKGSHAVGFISASHQIPQVKIIIKKLHQKGLHPTMVFNTNSYDKASTLRQLNGLIDVYLPDFKYANPALAGDLSQAADYPDVALAAIKEMYWQKGSSLIVNQRGEAESGLIIRHLVLPGFVDNSIKVLESIAENISTAVCVSLMAQYYPVLQNNQYQTLNRTLTAEEYQTVVEKMEELGFYKGWVQQLDSPKHYLPDFSKEEAFSN